MEQSEPARQQNERPGAAAPGMGPCWLGYINVADVDTSAASLIAAGGAKQMPAMDVPEVGRMAMVADPQGAVFYLMTPDGEDESTSFAPDTPGHGGWHELHTSNWEHALAFYRSQFGWQKVDAMDMGPMGTYLLFNAGAGEMIGGMFNSSEGERPHWLYYFNVEDIDAAKERVIAKGGTSMMGPHEVPSGAWIVQARDPQGALFALTGPRLEGK